jgi:hypothetical protein
VCLAGCAINGEPTLEGFTPALKMKDFFSDSSKAPQLLAPETLLQESTVLKKESEPNLPRLPTMDE